MRKLSLYNSQVVPIHSKQQLDSCVHCIQVQVCMLPLLCEPSLVYGITAHPMYQVTRMLLVIITVWWVSMMKEIWTLRKETGNNLYNKTEVLLLNVSGSKVKRIT